MRLSGDDECCFCVRCVMLLMLSYCARHSRVIFSHGGIGRVLYESAVFILKSQVNIRKSNITILPDP